MSNDLPPGWKVTRLVRPGTRLVALGDTSDWCPACGDRVDDHTAQRPRLGETEAVFGCCYCDCEVVLGNPPGGPDTSPDGQRGPKP